MSNVISFDQFESEHDIEPYQLGLPRIILEGQDDVRLFSQYWFTHLIDTFKFVEAGDVVDGSGCTAVRNAVEASIAENIPACGIADRDHLFRTKDWPALFETDDDAFFATTSDDDFYTTLRWEVEAYLLEPDLLPSWVRSHRNPPGTDALCNQALAHAIDECEHLLQTHSYFATAHHVGKKINPQHFKGISTPELPAACTNALNNLAHDGSVVHVLVPLVSQVLASAPTEPGARLRYLLRYVDTKRLLDRLACRFAAEPEVRWFLAELMRRSNERPAEIERRILDFRDRLEAAGMT
jgi:hypothetical protein